MKGVLWKPPSKEEDSSPMSFSVLIFVVLRLSHGNEVFADEIFLFMTLQKAMTGKDVDVHELGRLTVAWFLEDLGSMSLGGPPPC